MFEQHAPGVPVLAIPGNHDLGLDDAPTVWTRWIGPPQWRLDVRGWRIIGIDDAAGTISPASLELLRETAKDAPPRCGTVVIAHRPLAGHDPPSPNDPWEKRAEQLADTGITPSVTISGHWHHNDTSRDEQGVMHHLLGENCDRASSGDDRGVSKAVLTLAGDGASTSHDFRVGRVPRRLHVSGEFFRLAVGDVYPALRPHAVLSWAAVIAFAYAS